MYAIFWFLTTLQKIKLNIVDIFDWNISENQLRIYTLFKFCCDA